MENRSTPNLGGNQLLVFAAGAAIVIFLVMCLVGPGTKVGRAWDRAFNSAVQTSQHTIIARLDQTSPSQYASQQEYSTWWQSSCSAAAIAEVLNSYGNHYTIHDVLSAEINAQQISPQAGMLNGFGSVQQTVKQFGFQASQVSGGVDGIVNTANSGSPIIVSMSSSDWPGGHILIVTGGDSSTIQVIDSWTTNKTIISRSDFASQWTGLAAKITPGGQG